MADHKVIQKLIYLHERTTAAIQLWQGSRQARQCTPPSQALERQCSGVLYHCKCTGDNKVLGSSAQLTTGDVGGNEVTKKPRTGSCQGKPALKK